MDLPRRFNNKLKNKRACNAFGNNLWGKLIYVSHQVF
jgi:hypothetical protein